MGRLRFDALVFSLNPNAGLSRMWIRLFLKSMASQSEVRCFLFADASREEELEIRRFVLVARGEEGFNFLA